MHRRQRQNSEINRYSDASAIITQSSIKSAVRFEVTLAATSAQKNGSSSDVTSKNSNAEVRSRDRGVDDQGTPRRLRAENSSC